MGCATLAWLQLSIGYNVLFLTKVRGFSLVEAGTVVSAWGLVGTAGQVLLPFASDYLGRRPVILVSACLCAVSLAALYRRRVRHRRDAAAGGGERVLRLRPQSHRHRDLRQRAGAAGIAGRGAGDDEFLRGHDGHRGDAGGWAASSPTISALRPRSGSRSGRRSCWRALVVGISETAPRVVRSAGGVGAGGMRRRRVRSERLVTGVGTWPTRSSATISRLRSGPQSNAPAYAARHAPRCVRGTTFRG